MEAPLVVVIFSGGMDSMTALWWALSNGWQVHTLSFNYGQRHVRELVAAQETFDTWRYSRFPNVMGKWLGHTVVELRAAAVQCMTGGALTDPRVPVPHGHYTAPSMKLTVVPNRNMIFLALAVGRAESLKAEAVVYGAHAGDHAIYPDCRPAFAGAMSSSIREATDGAVKLEAPFLHKTKKQIAQLGIQLGVPYALSWSCYEGGDKHCGKCGTCVERKEAFEGLKDPTRYAA